jgi:hypothetical protein
LPEPLREQDELYEAAIEVLYTPEQWEQLKQPAAT